MLPNAFRRIWPASLALASLGGVALAFLIFTTYPLLWARWAFFTALAALFAGLTMPAAAYLHHRFPGQRPVSERTVLREGLWAGFYAGFLGWLQMGRMLTPWWAFLLALVLGALETLWLLSERSKKPF